MIKLAPSNLTYLFSECKRCWYMHTLNIWKRPYHPFPSVFNQMDKLLRNNFQNEDEGVYTKQKKIISQPFEMGGKTFVISGSVDCWVEHDDGSISIRDFKISNSKSVELLAPQLMAYRFIYESNGIRVNKLWVDFYYPNSFYDNTFGVEYTPIEVSGTREDFAIILRNISDLLDKDLEDFPESDCVYCKLQKKID
ncbi:MAG: PD-(D/E)XK nuclease family protein [Planktothrix sp.]